MRGSRRQIHFHSAHGSGRMAVKYCTELLPGPIMIDYTDYRGQFRAGEPDGRGRMRVNADVFEGTFYPSLSYGEYLIPFVGTRTLADGSTQDGTFILARGCCYKITDVCFESGFIMMSRYCLRVKHVGSTNDAIFEYATRTFLRTPVHSPVNRKVLLKCSSVMSRGCRTNGVMRLKFWNARDCEG